MNQDFAQNLGRQISGCRELLAVFQNERQSYQAAATIDLAQVMGFIEKKKTLLDVFQSGKSCADNASSNNTGTQAERDKLREMSRELSTLLEQLLVIDMENEKLLRKRLSEPAAASPQHARPSPRPSFQTRPSLKQQMPFCHNIPAQPASFGIPAPVAAQRPQTPAMAVAHTAPVIAQRQQAPDPVQSPDRAPKSHLRQYLQSQRLGAAVKCA